ncbi:MAG: methyltransferase [Boseongicola sp.]|nr:methyltransferase [Boseongicola sp.]
MTEATEDKFLGGALRILQPAKGYRAGADPVLLASATQATAGQSVLELGCGVGVAMFCLMHRVKGLSVVGVERNPALAELARLNAKAGDFDASIITADLAATKELNTRSFDHVIANPPYFDRSRGTSATDNSREGGRGEDTPLAIWIDVASRRLAPGGQLTVIQRTERLQDVLSVMDKRLGSIRILPLSAREGRQAQNTIITAKKGGRASLVLEAPFILHEGSHHDGDRDTYSLQAKKILRDGLGLSEARLIHR